MARLPGRIIWLCGLVLAFAIACTDARGKVVRESNTTSAAAPPVAAKVDTVLYKLVLFDRQPVPQPWDPNDGRDARCVRVIQSGWYRLTKDHWAKYDSVTVPCPMYPEDSSRVMSGRIGRAGDTLVFQEYRSSLHTTLLIDRGLIRGDTLHTGGDLFDGPPRVYLRVRR